MLKETHFEKCKNSNGEISIIRHFVLDNKSEADMLPANASVGSDAIAGDAVFIKLPNGWREI